MNFKYFFSFLLGLTSTINSQDSFLIGKPAPLFNASAVFPDGSVKNFSLQDYIGKNVVLYFYPMDNTPGCTIQAKKFRDNIQKLKAANIEVIGISCDSIKSHVQFQKKQSLPYPLVSDSRLKRTISKMYGSAGFLYSQRKTFLIDENGIVFKVFEQVDIQNQIEEIVAAFTKNGVSKKT